MPTAHPPSITCGHAPDGHTSLNGRELRLPLFLPRFTDHLIQLNLFQKPDGDTPHNGASEPSHLLGFEKQLPVTVKAK